MTAAGVETPRIDAEILLAAAMAVDRAALIAEPGRGLEPAQARAFQAFARRRTQREPVAYILGRRGFRRLELEVDPRVLIPRPETEHVVEAALELPRGARVVDVGTGSGAIALALADERPDLRVTATDASAPALAVARANAERMGLPVEFLEGDLLSPVSGRVDAVVANPPYVRTGERLPPEIARYEPADALYAGPDGLEVLRRLAPAAAAAGASFAAFEVGAGQAADVAALLRAEGYATDVIRDLAGIERVVTGEVRGSDPLTRFAAPFEACLAGGGVAVFPADTVYGLACDPEDRGAVAKLYRLKGRPPEKPAAVMFFDRGRALAALPEIGPRTRALLERLLPGAVTVLVPSERFPLAGGSGTLGLRVPDLPTFAAVSRPALQSSANLTGGPDATRLDEVPEPIRRGADLVLDGGALAGTPSTVVDLRDYETKGQWRVVRVGAVPEAVIRSLA
jgi:release factor glutamine methyltransferase